MKKPRDHKTEYARRVALGAAKGLTRSQARGHARGGEAVVRSAKASEKNTVRLHAAYKDMRRTGNLSKSAKAFGISPERLRRAVKEQGLAERLGHGWQFTDDRPRKMTVLTNGEAVEITLADFDQASLNGRHDAAVKQFIRTNDIDLLAPFVGTSVIDAAGNSYPLETDPNALHRLMAAGEPFHFVYRLVI